MLTASAGLLFVSLMLTLTQRQLASGQLDRNAALGIRTKATQSSDAAWSEGHRAAGPWLQMTAITGYVASATAIVTAVGFLVADRSSAAPLVVALGGYVGVVVLLVLAARKADSAARSTQQP